MQCKQYQKTFKNFGNTNNLLKHFKKAHPLIYTASIERLLSPKKDRKTKDNSNYQTDDDPNAVVDTTSQADNENAPPLRKRQLQMKFLSKDAVQQNSNAIDKALVKMTCLDFQPLQIVENKGFIDYTYQLNSNYKLPSRKTLFEKLLTEHYTLACAATKEKLQTVDFIAVRFVDFGQQ